MRRCSSGFGQKFNYPSAPSFEAYMSDVLIVKVRMTKIVHCTHGEHDVHPKLSLDIRDGWDLENFEVWTSHCWREDRCRWQTSQGSSKDQLILIFIGLWKASLTNDS